MSLFARLFGGRRPNRAEAAPLYAAIVAAAREPHWYVEGAVPDTVDGRFDTVAAVLSLVLVRLERELERRQFSALLAEAFVEDMDEQLRQIGVGDVMVGKHVGRMMGALGGRLTAYRKGLADADGRLEAALERNLYRGAAPSRGAMAHVASRMRALFAALEATDGNVLVAGTLPR